MICRARVILFLVVFSVSPLFSKAFASQVLVYRDKGVCPEKCAEAIGTLAAKQFGPVKYVKANQLTARTLQDAKVWIQPGGDAIEVAETLTTRQKQLLRDFVARGGAYLGICAGAFLADHFADDNNKVPGLGLIPGVSRDFLPGNANDLILQVLWNFQPRFLYFQAGATFEFDHSRPVETVAKYTDGRPATVQFRYGKGVVILSGPHPEAPEAWKISSHLDDKDGEDFDLANDLLERAGWGSGLLPL